MEEGEGALDNPIARWGLGWVYSGMLTVVLGVAALVGIGLAPPNYFWLVTGVSAAIGCTLLALIMPRGRVGFGIWALLSLIPIGWGIYAAWGWVGVGVCAGLLVLGAALAVYATLRGRAEDRIVEAAREVSGYLEIGDVEEAWRSLRVALADLPSTSAERRRTRNALCVLRDCADPLALSDEQARLVRTTVDALDAGGDWEALVTACLEIVRTRGEAPVSPSALTLVRGLEAERAWRPPTDRELMERSFDSRLSKADRDAAARELAARR